MRIYGHNQHRSFNMDLSYEDLRAMISLVKGRNVPLFLIVEEAFEMKQFGRIHHLSE